MKVTEKTCEGSTEAALFVDKVLSCLESKIAALLCLPMYGQYGFKGNACLCFKWCVFSWLS